MNGKSSGKTLADKFSRTADNGTDGGYLLEKGG